MVRITALLLVCLLLAGCVTMDRKSYYEDQLQEIEEAYQKGEITKDEYIQLKNEVKKARMIKGRFRIRD